MRYVCFDISNLLYRTFFANRAEEETVVAGLATHSGMTTLNKYFKMFKPDRIVMAFDRHSWRKTYTASEECVSKKPYKGNRNKDDMTPSEKEKYKRFIDHMKVFEQMIQEHTTIISLAANELEADDLIAGFCQMHTSEDDEIIVVSTDSDLLQLCRQSNVRVVSPATDKDQSLEEYDGDAEFYTFVKCFRGDRTDNVLSAYPRVHMSKLKKAYTDPFMLVQILKTKWTDQNKTEFLVEDLFFENELLINLTRQPPHIRELIEQTITDELNRTRKFSMFYLLKFVGKYQLKKILENIANYTPMLSLPTK